MAGATRFIFEATVTEQQRSWWNAAVSLSQFAFDRAGLTITVKTVPDPPCPGHNDYMCTQTAGDGTATTFIRAGADDVNAPFNAAVKDDLRNFFMESVIHEVAHAFFNTYVTVDDAHRTTVSGWFINDGGHLGTLENFTGGEWADHTEEAIAEFFKDVYLPATYRHYDQRTTWDFVRSNFEDFFEAIEEVVCYAAEDGGPGPTG